MQVAIFGASGATGRLLTAGAVERGHTVTALVRRPVEFPLRDHAGVTVLEGSPFSGSDVSRTIAGADVVMSALGTRSPFEKGYVLERAVPFIVSAMEDGPVKRLIVLGSAGALAASLDKQAAWRRWVVEKIVYRTFLKYPVASQVFQYRALAASTLEWTMVMPPMLTNGPARGSYRVDADALPRGGSQISRADVASFMLDQLASPEYTRRGVYLSQ